MINNKIKLNLKMDIRINVRDEGTRLKGPRIVVFFLAHRIFFSIQNGTRMYLELIEKKYGGGRFKEDSFVKRTESL